MATTLDCLLHPIDCAHAASTGDVTRESLREGTRRATSESAQTAEDAANVATEAGGRTGNFILDLETGATAPLDRLASTAMWTTIGIVAASIVILIVFGYIVLKVL